MRLGAGRRTLVRASPIAAVLAVGALAAAGCGGSAPSSPAPVHSADAAKAKQAAARRARESQIAALQQKIRQARRARRRSGRASAAGAGAAGTIAGFDAFAAGLGGEVGAVVGSPDGSSVETGGSLKSGSAWSTIKVPIAAKVIEDAGGPDGLSASQRSLIERAITASDNDAAAGLWSQLESRHGGLQGAADAVTGILRKAGDDTTEVSTQGRADFSPYGQTEWSLLGQHKFMTALAGGCVVSGAASHYLLGLMGHVTADTWGLGSAGVPAAWKGGWGPGAGGGYLVRQMGETHGGGGSVIVTLAALPSGGSFEAGQQLASNMARWLAQHSDAVAGSGSPC